MTDFWLNWQLSDLYDVVIRGISLCHFPLHWGWFCICWSDVTGIYLLGWRRWCHYCIFHYRPDRVNEILFLVIECCMGIASKLEVEMWIVERWWCWRLSGPFVNVHVYHSLLDTVALSRIFPWLLFESLGVVVCSLRRICNYYVISFNNVNDSLKISISFSLFF